MSALAPPGHLKGPANCGLYRSSHRVCIDHVGVSVRPGESSNIKGCFLLSYLLSLFCSPGGPLVSHLRQVFQGLVVRKLDGSRCDWKAALIRSALRLVEVNPLLLGGLPAGLVIIASERKQRIGDLLAGTLVVSAASQWDDNSVEPASEPAL